MPGGLQSIYYRVKLPFIDKRVDLPAHFWIMQTADGTTVTPVHLVPPGTMPNANGNGSDAEPLFSDDSYSLSDAASVVASELHDDDADDASVTQVDPQHVVVHERPFPAVFIVPALPDVDQVLYVRFYDASNSNSAWYRGVVIRRFPSVSEKWTMGRVKLYFMYDRTNTMVRWYESFAAGNICML